jgi:hypothetical protein
MQSGALALTLVWSMTVRLVRGNQEADQVNYPPLDAG